MLSRAPVSIQSTRGSTPHVVDKVGSTNVVLKAGHQGRRPGSVPAVSKQTDTVSSTCFQSSQRVRWTLEAGCVANIQSLVLKIVVTVSSAAVGMPGLPFWFERIDWRGNGGSTLLATTYAEEMFQKLSIVPKDKLHTGYLDRMNFGPDWKPKPALGVGTHTFYLPLPVGWIDSADIDWEHVRGDLVAEIWTRGGSTSGSITNLACDEISFLINTHALRSKADREESARLAHKATLAANYLEAQPQRFLSTTLQAGVKTRFKLDALTGNMAYLLLGIRDLNATNTGNKYQICKGLQNGTLDIQNSSQQSIIGLGTAIDVDFLKSHFYSAQFPNHFWQKSGNWYLIPFTKNVRAAMAGSMREGYLHFSPQKAAPYLELGVPAAATDMVQTITLAGANQGEYRLSFTFGGRTCLSTALALNSSTAQIKAALEALPNARDAPGSPITFSASGQFNANSGVVSITITSDTRLTSDDLVRFVNEFGDNNPGDTTVTTPHTPGWTATSGNSYDVVVYGFGFKRAYVGQKQLATGDI